MVNDNDNLRMNASDLSKECRIKFLNDIYKNGCTNGNY